jgi:hypothetical protein
VKHSLRGDSREYMENNREKKSIRARNQSS